MQNVDDPSQTSFYIPFTPDNEEDIPQQTAYRASWSKCLTQLRSEIRMIYQSTVDAIVDCISSPPSDTLPGLPYPELPLIAVHSASTLFIDTLLVRLSTTSTTAISHLYPSDSPNISTAMKSLLANFVPPLQKLKHDLKLASYDISILNSNYTPSDPLLVVLHDFEQFDPAVMQDLLYICSTRIPALHLTFLGFLSSPLAGHASFIHATYPRSTLTRLRIHSFSVQTGRTVLERLLLKAFFSPSFEPDIMLGPTALEGIVDHYTRHNGSIDALLTSIQLVHLKHFLVEPLSLLIHPQDIYSSDQTYESILSLLYSRIPESPSDSLLVTFQRHESVFRTASRNFRLGFTLLHTTTTFLISKGYKPFPTHSAMSSSATNTTTNLMRSALRGHTTREIRTLALYIKKLRPEVLHELLTALNDVFTAVHDHDQYKSSRKKLRSYIAQISRSEETESESEFDSEEFSIWFSTHLASFLKPLDKLTLWDVWHTGSTPFPVELVNPSLRATILSALLRPYDFTLPLRLPSNTPRPLQDPPLSPTVSDIEAQFSSSLFLQPSTLEDERKAASAGLHKLPDTSILFSRYLDSGKLINIYDWYESYKIVLDVQREEQLASRKKVASRNKKSRSSPKKKKKLRGKTSNKVAGKQKAIVDEDEEMEEKNENEEEEPVDEESWQREVQARFIRAFHELDYLGFIKHTGRKLEHVAKTVFDVGDEGDEQDLGEDEDEESA